MERQLDLKHICRSSVEINLVQWKLPGDCESDPSVDFK